MKKENKNKFKGFSIIEIIIYLAIFTTLSVLVINSFITILSSFNTTNVNRKLLESGSFIMERMSREIRQAKNIDIASSTLGVSPGVLQLNSTNSAGAVMVIKFVILNQIFNLYKDGSLVGNLTDNDVRITNLIFKRIITTESEAVKIEMTIEYSNGQITKSEKFYNTIVLRGGY